MTVENPIIETRALTRRFGTQLAVDNLNLSVPAAGVYGFLGPNGAGKTTAIRMLLGLIRPNAGEVHLFGKPLPANRHSLMQHVGALVETDSYVGRYALVRISNSTRRRHRWDFLCTLRSERVSWQILSVVVADESLY
ncbi:MAG TPA: ATP-binding cassette domain-containing protein [Pyrinomonadaceae bacterium]|nr:ATP-binding cassette domain-containing protein [Pyrinomonadaceae bacterium]